LILRRQNQISEYGVSNGAGIAFQDKILGLMLLLISWDIYLAILYYGTRGASRALADLEIAL